MKIFISNNEKHWFLQIKIFQVVMLNLENILGVIGNKTPKHFRDVTLRFGKFQLRETRISRQLN